MPDEPFEKMRRGLDDLEAKLTRLEAMPAPHPYCGAPRAIERTFAPRNYLEELERGGEQKAAEDAYRGAQAQAARAQSQEERSAACESLLRAQSAFTRLGLVPPG